MTHLGYFIQMIALVFIIIGALNWGLVALGFNLVSFIANNTFASLEPTVYVLVGVSALLHLFARNYYLPFLGDSVFPCASMTEKIPTNATVSTNVQIEPLTNIVYWAAEALNCYQVYFYLLLKVNNL